MSRALKLDPDRKLAIREADVERTCIEWMELRPRSYLWVPTKAEDIRRGGGSRFDPGTLDGVFVHAWRPAIWTEFKRRFAKTDKKRLLLQTLTVTGLRGRGFLVYQAREKDPDPIGSFQQFVKNSL